MKIQEITAFLEKIAPPFLQESYDNAGLLTGNFNWECSGVLIALDCTEDIVLEAVSKNCNLIVAHHPIIFGGLKKITGKNYVEKTIIAAIKNDIAIYAIHTNLDNMLTGVNKAIADKLGLINQRILSPKENILKKIICFVPADFSQKIRDAIFVAGAGQIGNYSECSFNSEGFGTFKPNENAQPFSGKKNEPTRENEIKIEAIFPAWAQNNICNAIRNAHPYEEPAFDIIALENTSVETGSGLIGELEMPVPEIDFLEKLSKLFGLKSVKHTALLGKNVEKLALCGGAGSFLISAARQAGADFYISSDIKYHEFFDANGQIVVADIGHYESEQYTIDLLFDILTKKFPTFAVLKTGVNTNPVYYFAPNP